MDNENGPSVGTGGAVVGGGVGMQEGGGGLNEVKVDENVEAPVGGVGVQQSMQGQGMVVGGAWQGKKELLIWVGLIVVGVISIVVIAVGLIFLMGRGVDEGEGGEVRSGLEASGNLSVDAEEIRFGEDVIKTLYGMDKGVKPNSVESCGEECILHKYDEGIFGYDGGTWLGDFKLVDQLEVDGPMDSWSIRAKPSVDGGKYLSVKVVMKGTREDGASASDTKVDISVIFEKKDGSFEEAWEKGIGGMYGVVMGNRYVNHTFCENGEIELSFKDVGRVFRIADSWCTDVPTTGGVLGSRYTEGWYRYEGDGGYIVVWDEFMDERISVVTIDENTIEMEGVEYTLSER